MSTPSGDSKAKSPNVLEAILAKYAGEEGAVIAILQEVQAAYGYVPPEAIETIADSLRLSPSQVYGVLSFYNEFTTVAPGKKILTVCNGPTCRIRGGTRIEDLVRETLGVDEGETTDDGEYTFKTSACLGLCAHAPSIQVNHDLVGRMTVGKAEMVLRGDDVDAVRGGQ
ncbi:MAG: NAD(P)H-dependent oxidoreductase subunit E [Chloroflexi bacterium]|nr:NAD(P)H-dependent oxidoreductase subunit E [Chloroflexota bacterium]